MPKEYEHDIVKQLTERLRLLTSDLSFMKAQVESRNQELAKLVDELREAKTRNLHLWKECRELEAKIKTQIMS